MANIQNKVDIKKLLYLMKVQEWNCNRGNNLLISFLHALVNHFICSIYKLNPCNLYKKYCRL